MCARGSRTAARDRAGPGQKRSLTRVRFVGSFPTANFRLDAVLPEVALLGRSNVGKSTLINAILGRKALARTSRDPGKTRMCNAYCLNDRLYLMDLPGYGYARAPHQERRRIGRLMVDYLSHRATLTGVVWLLDIRRDPSNQDREMASRLAARDTPVMLAITKADKLGRRQRQERICAILDAVGLPADQMVVTSAKTGEGIDDLRDSVLALAECEGTT